MYAHCALASEIVLDEVSADYLDGSYPKYVNFFLKVFVFFAIDK